MPHGKKLIVGNWKMNPPTTEEAKAIFRKIKRIAGRIRKSEVVICPSEIHLSALARLASGGKVSLGVQDVFWEDEGFFTGQVSPMQARDAGATYAIVGHSEKRKLGETNEQVAKKLKAVVRDGLVGILCIGEAERDRDGRFYDVLASELLGSLSEVKAEALKKSVVIAYEPIWEIGRADMRAMKPLSVHETSIFIRKVINDAFGAQASHAVPILYGGSVSAENARAIVFDGEMDGLLIGRQSLDANAFSEILKQIDSSKNGKK